MQESSYSFGNPSEVPNGEILPTEIDFADYQEKIKIAITKDYNGLMADLSAITDQANQKIEEIKAKYLDSKVVGQTDVRTIDLLRFFIEFRSNVKIKYSLNALFREKIGLSSEQRKEVTDKITTGLEEEWYRMATVLDKDKPLQLLFEKRLKNAEIDVGVFDVEYKWEDILKTREIFESCLETQQKMTAASSILRALEANTSLEPKKQEVEPKNSWEFELEFDSTKNLASYEKSFLIEGPRGEFLGECGLEFNHNKNLDLWVFDKDDLNTDKVSYCVGEENRLKAERIGSARRAIDLTKESESIDVLETESLKVSVKFENIVFNHTYLENTLRPIEKFSAKITVTKK